MKFSFLFSGRRPPTHPGCHQEFPPHEGRPHEVPDQGLRGRMSGKKKTFYISFVQNKIKIYKNKFRLFVDKQCVLDKNTQKQNSLRILRRF